MMMGRMGVIGMMMVVDVSAQVKGGIPAGCMRYNDGCNTCSVVRVCSLPFRNTRERMLMVARKYDFGMVAN